MIGCIYMKGEIIYRVRWYQKMIYVNFKRIGFGNWKYKVQIS